MSLVSLSGIPAYADEIFYRELLHLHVVWQLSTSKWKKKFVCKLFFPILKISSTAASSFQAYLLPLQGCYQDREEIF